MTKTYLGDGVYCEKENDMIKLWTSNGVDNSEPIYLEYDVFFALLTFADVVMKWKQK